MIYLLLCDKRAVTFPQLDRRWFSYLQSWYNSNRTNMTNKALSPVCNAQLFDNNGNMLSGGTITVYKSGTLTLAPVYANAEGGALANPIALNASGRIANGQLFLDLGLYYDIQVKKGTTVLESYSKITGLLDTAGGVLGSVTIDSFVGNGTTAIFTLTSAPDSVSITTVVVDGLTLTPTVDYQVVSNQITFTVAPGVSSEIIVRYNTVVATQAESQRDRLYNGWTTTAGVLNYNLDKDPGSITNLIVSLDGLVLRPLIDYTWLATLPNTLTLLADPGTGKELSCSYGDLLPIVGTVDSDQVDYLPGGTGAVLTVQAKLREFVSVKDFGTVGNGIADDTAAIQAAITYCHTNGNTLYIPSGTYKITNTLLKPQSFNCPNIIGDGEKFTKLIGVGLPAGAAVLKIKGGSGDMSGGVVSGIWFDGGSENCIEVADQNGVLLKNIRFTNASIAIKLHNESSGGFTEFVVAENCDFRSSCIQSLVYTVSSGNDSFHGSGLRNCTINELAGRLGQNITIGAGALVYNAPMSFQIWKRTAQPVIRHDGSNKSNIYGTITLELSPSITPSLASGTLLYVVGNVLGFTQGVDLTGCVLCHRLNVNSDGSVNAEMIRKNSSVSCTTGANSLGGVGSDTSTLVQATFRASNYEYVYLLSVYQNTGDTSGVAATVATLRTFNTAGYGAPTFSYSSGNLVATNASWPASGVTAYLSFVPIGTRYQNRLLG